MESGINTGVEPLEDNQDTKQDKKVDGENTNQPDGGTDKTNVTTKPDEPEDGTTKSGESNKQEESTTDKKKKSKHKKFIPSVNVSALKALEGITTSSFLDIVKAVILIDGKPYNKNTTPLSMNRKITFKRLIEHYALLESVGERQYYIKLVYSKKQREELNELAINTIKDKSKNSE